MLFPTRDPFRNIAELSLAFQFFRKFHFILLKSQNSILNQSSIVDPAEPHNTEGKDISLLRSFARHAVLTITLTMDPQQEFIQTIHALGSVASDVWSPQRRRQSMQRILDELQQQSSSSRQLLADAAQGTTPQKK